MICRCLGRASHCCFILSVFLVRLIRFALPNPIIFLLWWGCCSVILYGCPCFTLRGFSDLFLSGCAIRTSGLWIKCFLSLQLASHLLLIKRKNLLLVSLSSWLDRLFWNFITKILHSATKDRDVFLIFTDEHFDLRMFLRHWYNSFIFRSCIFLLNVTAWTTFLVHHQLWGGLLMRHHHFVLITFIIVGALFFLLGLFFIMVLWQRHTTSTIGRCCHFWACLGGVCNCEACSSRWLVVVLRCRCVETCGIFTMLLVVLVLCWGTVFHYSFCFRLAN
mgnify:CR=1 FL=1